jgi:thioester reductase-like protein
MDSIIDYLEHWAGIQPDSRLSAFLDIHGRETDAYTYSEFHKRTRFLAECLAEVHGLTPGARVLLVYPPGLEVSAAFFACARIGAIPVPVCPPTPLGFERSLAKLAFIVRDCQASTALTSSDFYNSYQKLRDERPTAKSSVSAPEVPALHWIATDALRGVPSERLQNATGPVLFLQYTSGSTSDPKGVIVSDANIIHNAQSTVDHKAIGVSWLPHYHDMGLIGYHLYPVITGATVYSFSPMDFLKRPLLWLQTMSRVRATYSSSPNFGFEHCLREEKTPAACLDDLDLSSVRVLMNASEPVNTDTCLRFRERFAPYGLRPEALVAAYGLAENTLTATNYGTRFIAVDKRTLQRGKVRVLDDRPSDTTQLRLASCGKPLSGVHLQIVAPESRAALGSKQIGEIWLAGNSTCKGYWNRETLTKETFANAIIGEPQRTNTYLRTGDLGFLYEDELFVCGRIKDLIIVNGINYHPQDIEFTVESSSPKIRRGGVAAFHGDQDRETLVIIAEVKTVRDLPDPAAIVRAIRTQCYVEPCAIVFVASGTVVRTTSGKIARSSTRLRWLDGDLRTIATHHFTPRKEPIEGSSLRGRFLQILERYHLTGNENSTFVEVGIDSLTLVSLLVEIERSFQPGRAVDLLTQLDAWLIQRLTIAAFFSLLDQAEAAPAGGEAALRSFLERLKQNSASQEKASMQSDARLETLAHIEVRENAAPLANVLLTGPTGFFGPFLLNSLLNRTPYTYYALTRANDPVHGMDRIRASLHRARLWGPFLDEELKRRVHVVCGDLTHSNLGLCSQQWQMLATRIQAVLHNGALVNYVLNYEALKPHNIDGTRELLRFSNTGIAKEFHLISSTIIFGWTQQREVYETDCNASMVNLDFGYSQTKWVAEQLVFAAGQQGLNVRIYRPAFLSPSSRGAGGQNDVAILLLAFMIKYGIAMRARNQISFLPADVAADNIVAIFDRRPALNATFHVTADDYYNMMDITNLIALNYGYPFVYYEVPDFVAEVNRLCTREDPLYPLLPFINRSYPNITSMQHKRYNNDQYRKARRRNCGPPSLKNVVSYLMAYLFREGMIPGRP